MAIQGQGTTATDPSKAPTTLPLKWLTDKQRNCMGCAMAFNNRETASLRTFGTGTAKYSAFSPWNSPVFAVKTKSGK